MRLSGVTEVLVRMTQVLHRPCIGCGKLSVQVNASQTADFSEPSHCLVSVDTSAQAMCTMCNSLWRAILLLLHESRQNVVLQLRQSLEAQQGQQV